MKTQAKGQNKRWRPSGLCRKLFKLTIAGAVAFWLISIATSLLPIAVKYRAAYSNWSIQTVWADSLAAGMVIACCVSYSLLRFVKDPEEGPISKSMKLSSIALVIAIAAIDVPMIDLAASTALHYFFIGVAFNTARFLSLGFTVGYVNKRLYSHNGG